MSGSWKAVGRQGVSMDPRGLLAFSTFTLFATRTG